jgi:hypothetical protein
MAFDILVKHGGTGLKDYLSALLKPLQTNTDSLKSFETEYTKRSKFNGRKMVLQAALNDIFGISISPFIIIEWNRNTSVNTYFFEPEENNPIFFYDSLEEQSIYMNDESELSSIDYDFKVLIPAAIHTTELERRVRAETELYKLAGTRFIIETY